MIEKVSASGLKSRWRTDVLAEVNDALAAGKIEFGPEVGWVEDSSGRYRDLRGFLMVKRAALGIKLGRIDLSYCAMREWADFTYAEFENCRFIQSRLTGNFGHSAVNCDFSGATFGVALRGSYTDCRFRGSSFVRNIARKLTFTRCDFTGSDFHRGDIQESVFDHCVWSDCEFGYGSLTGCKFIGTRPDSTALGDTIMDRVTFVE